MEVIGLIFWMSRKISSVFVVHGIIHEEDRDVYVYSFEVLLSTLMSFVVLIVLSIISRTILETALYLIGFLPLRQIAGGYHAKNHFRCFLIMLFSYLTLLTLLHYLPTSAITPVTCAGGLLSVFSVYLFAPSEDTNKPLSDKEVLRFRRKSRLSIIVYSIVIGIFTVFVSDKIFALSLALGVFTAAASLLANFIKYKIRKVESKPREEGNR